MKTIESFIEYINPVNGETDIIEDIELDLDIDEMDDLNYMDYSNVTWETWRYTDEENAIIKANIADNFTHIKTAFKKSFSESFLNENLC